MKRFVFIIVLLYITVSVLAEEFTIGKLTFETISSNEVELVYVDTAITSVYLNSTITYQGVKYSITSLGNWAFSGCAGLTSLTIPNGVTNIGDFAFCNCSGLASIDIPNSVINVGEGAFTGCTKLSSPVYNAHCFAYMPTSFHGHYIIPNGIKQIAGAAFKGCTDLSSVTIPNTIKSIDERAFENTGVYNNLANWTKGALYINNCLIAVDDNIVGDYIIYDNTRLIASCAFSFCRTLTSVTIPNSVTSIGTNAFNCTGITSIMIPKSVTSIGSNVLCSCDNLTSIFVEDGNTHYDSRYDCNAIIESSTNTLIAGCRSTTIPNDVTIIGDYAFYGCEGLTFINIPNNVKHIGNAAFFDCINLSCIVIPNSVTSIGKDAFWNCDKLNSINVPYGVKTIEEYMFWGCSSLTSITIPSSVTHIKMRAFAFCSSLTSLTIPESVISIDQEAFWTCESLTTVIIPKSIKYISKTAFPLHTRIIYKE